MRIGSVDLNSCYFFQTSTFILLSFRNAPTPTRELVLKIEQMIQPRQPSKLIRFPRIQAASSNPATPKVAQPPSSSSLLAPQNQPSTENA